MPLKSFTNIQRNVPLKKIIIYGIRQINKDKNNIYKAVAFK